MISRITIKPIETFKWELYKYCNGCDVSSKMPFISKDKFGIAGKYINISQENTSIYLLLHMQDSAYIVGHLKIVLKLDRGDQTRHGNIWNT